MLKAVVYINTLILTIVILYLSTRQDNPRTIALHNEAVADVARILNESYAHQGLRKKFEESISSHETYVSHLESQLREHYQKLSAKREELVSQDLPNDEKSTLAEKLDAERRNYDSQVAKLHTHGQIYKESLNTAFENAKKEIYEHLQQVIEEVARDFNLKIVIQQVHVLYNSKDLDVTDHIIKRLNSLLPIVKTPIPSTFLPSDSSFPPDSKERVLK